MLYVAGFFWLIVGLYPNPQTLFFTSFVIFASLLAYRDDIEQKDFYPFIYPTIGFIFLVVLYNNYGIDSLIWLVAIVAGADIGAFVVGKSVGATPFNKTSPNKTMEGVIGGLVISIILGLYFGLDELNWFLTLIISFLVSLSSIFGDLFESYLKRQADIKDSGTLLAGHGGVLDRADGYLFASVIMTVLLSGII